MEPDGPSIAGMERVLRKFGGNPDTVDGVLALVPLALTNMLWRNNEAVEEWHVAGRLSDGDMLRTNTFTTREINSLLGDWRGRHHLVADSSPSAMESLSISDFEELTSGLVAWMSWGTRLLPTGQRLEDLAGEGLPVFSEHVEDRAGDWLDSAVENGIRWAFTWAAGHGATACRKWWGAPTWHERVSLMIDALQDPQHPHWGLEGERWPRWEQPSPLADLGAVREVLLSTPWAIDTAGANWLVAAGLGWVNVADCSVTAQPGREQALRRAATLGRDETSSQ